MKLRSAVSLVTLLLGAVAVLAGCGVDRNHQLSPTAPVIPAPPESTWVEICDTTLVRVVSGGDAELSAAHPIAWLTELLEVPCDHNIIPDVLVVTNNGVGAIALVKYLQTLPGVTPPRRYYFTRANGDTLLRPSAAYGSQSTFDLRAGGVPAGQYSSIARYKGEVSAPAGSARPASAVGTLCDLTLRDVMQILCVDCRDVKMPVKP